MHIFQLYLKTDSFGITNRINPIRSTTVNISLSCLAAQLSDRECVFLAVFYKMGSALPEFKTNASA
jgi:hypothetical protein